MHLVVRRGASIHSYALNPEIPILKVSVVW